MFRTLCLEKIPLDVCSSQMLFKQAFSQRSSHDQYVNRSFETKRLQCSLLSYILSHQLIHINLLLEGPPSI